MVDHVYKLVELVGSLETSLDDAIQTAIKRADQTLRNLHWFKVVHIVIMDPGLRREDSTKLV